MEKLTDAGMAAQLAGAVGVGPVDVGTDVAGGGATVVGGAGALKVFVVNKYLSRDLCSLTM